MSTNIVNCFGRDASLMINDYMMPTKEEMEERFRWVMGELPFVTTIRAIGIVKHLPKNGPTFHVKFTINRSDGSNTKCYPPTVVYSTRRELDSYFPKRVKVWGVEMNVFYD